MSVVAFCFMIAVMVGCATTLVITGHPWFAFFLFLIACGTSYKKTE